jgi:hypothetical protein
MGARQIFPFARPDREPAKRVLQAIALDLFDKAATVQPHQSSQDEITLGRAAAIEEFVTLVDRSGLNFHRPDLMIECRQIIEMLDRSDCAAALRKFTTEEEQALASLAQSINDAPRGREDPEGPDVHDSPRA